MNGENGGIRVRPVVASDGPFVLAAAERLGDFGPPFWRTKEEIVEADLRVLRAFFEEPAEGSSLLVAESEDARPLGFIYLETLRDYFLREAHGHVGIVAVVREAEGRGAGSALMRAAERWARERGYRRLTLNVFHGNERARSLYERLGYRPETLRYLKLL